MFKKRKITKVILHPRKLLYRDAYPKTQRSRVLLKKLTVVQIVKKFPHFYGTPRLISVFIRVCHWPTI
jgi:hypothetical protein